MHTCDAPIGWKLMLDMLLGQPLPELPTQRGRVIRAPEIETPEADAERIESEQQAAQVWRELASDTEGGDHD